MVTTLTYLTGLDRARPAAAPAHPMSTMRAWAADCGVVVNPCGTTGLTGFPQTIKPTTRLLGTRST